jgi:hypothetical protein
MVKNTLKQSACSSIAAAPQKIELEDSLATRSEML